MSPESDILKYLEAHIEPFDGLSGPRYAASAVLTDGTILPRVVFYQGMDRKSTAEYLREKCGDVARFDRALKSLTRHSRIESKYVVRAERSPFAIPRSIYQSLQDPQERQEFANFSLEMSDRRVVYFDIANVEDWTGPPEFITLPAKYSFNDVWTVRRCVNAPPGEAVMSYGEDPVFHCDLAVDSEVY
jgi:hypothetical protein